MDQSEQFLTGLQETADIELSTKEDNGDISVKSQQCGFTELEQSTENSQCNVLSNINNSNENATLSELQDYDFIILQEGNALDAWSSGCLEDVLPTISADKDDIETCMPTSSVSIPLPDFQTALGETSIEVLKISEEDGILTYPSHYKNEFQPATSSNSLNAEWRRHLLFENDDLIAASFEGSENENLLDRDIPMTMDNAKEVGFSNVPKKYDQQFILQNFDRSQHQILTGVDSHTSELNTSVPAINTEGITGFSSMNAEGQDYFKDGNFICRKCGKGFSCKISFMAHRETHSGDKWFACDMCGKIFSQKGHLYRHIRTHTKEKPFPCDICGKCFSQKYNLNSHLHTHTGEKPFNCDECGESFSEKRSLTRHRRIHTGEKPYLCPVCGKFFAHYSSCKRHTKSVHKEN